MKLSFAEKINTPVCEEKENEIKVLLFEEFRRISDNCIDGQKYLNCSSINASFGSILRNDSTIITMKARKKQDGYNIVADTEYKPSGFFWIFFVIDILLIETIIGFVLGMGITLGLYFYNKKLVAEGIETALRNVKNQIE
ncbi:MAG: hypothetical protein E7040_03055 [Lentisphaerae bacterium]|nr:hypothetical protein [Lentisphaerota bacterium]